ncbi:response regulator (plasmid) [Burkholderia gladioli pv. alliicola]|uniref:Response regulator n=1 Tax=Burkholderia gladioli TaxID=28095 RepID=A0A2A7SA47_BURGA|nr:response regulator [Burkholderia gladioli]PEH40527.1 response regulator [Burkholderia gladioli]
MEFGTTGICSGRRVPKPLGRPVRVLVVDDHEDSGDIVSLYLSVMGFDAHYVAEPEKAEEEAGRYGPDIVLIDINMPRMDGFAVAAALRHAGLTHHTVLVAYTSESWDNIETQALAAGFDGYFRKATAPAELVVFLSAYVDAN